ETFAQLGRHRGGVVAADIEAATLLRPVVGKARDNEMAAFGDRSPGQLNILTSVRRIGQEVEDSPVMPDIEGADILNPGYIGRDPFDAPGTLAQPSSGPAQGGFGDIEYRDSAEPNIDQPIDEHRVTAANIDDATPGGGSNRADQLERQERIAL